MEKILAGERECYYGHPLRRTLVRDFASGLIFNITIAYIQYKFYICVMSSESSTNALSLKRLPALFFGFVGFVSAILGIYSYVKEKEPNIEFQILSNSNVFDVNTDLSKLDITYDSVSLKNSNQNLRVINVRVKNTGDIDILKNYYDEKDPIGFVVSNGGLIEKPIIIAASNPYLRTNLTIFNTINKVTFSSVILEKGEYFDVKILLLHPKRTKPSLLATGKIAGIRKIKVLEYQTKEKRTFWNIVFEGDIIIQITKSLIYGIILILAFFVVLFIVLGLQDYRSKLRRKKTIENFKRSGHNGYVYDPIDEPIFDRIISDGYGAYHWRILRAAESDLNRMYKKGLSESDKHAQYEKRRIDKMLLDGIFILLNKDTLLVDERKRMMVLSLQDYAKKHSKNVEPDLKDMLLDLE